MQGGGRHRRRLGAATGIALLLLVAPIRATPSGRTLDRPHSVPEPRPVAPLRGFQTGAPPAPLPDLDPYAEAPSYVRLVTPAPNSGVRPLLTVGQRLPLTEGSTGQTYLVVGNPDGMGARIDGDELLLLLNHEFGRSSGVPAGPLPAGARISEFRLARTDRGPEGHPPLPDAVGPDDGLPPSVRRAVPLSGRAAIERLFLGDPPAPVAPGTRRLARLCSASLAGDDAGFDRPLYFAGEETQSPDSFDGRGGLAFVLDGRSLYALPGMGHASWENIVPAHGTGDRTVLFGLEDGPSGGDALGSQLYMYVGERVVGSSDMLAANGLNGGRLYVLAADDPQAASEAMLWTRGGRAAVRWEAIEPRFNDSTLEMAARAAGAFGFVRIEDGATDPRRPGVLYFATTGRPGTANPLGHIWRLEFDAADPTGPAALTLMLDGSEGIVGPDNLAMNRHGELAILEDPTQSLLALGLSRDTSMFILDVDDQRLTRVAEIDRDTARSWTLAADPRNRNLPGADRPGGWELSGIIDAEPFLGRGSWLLTAMAHSLRIFPSDQTVEGGQVLHLVVRPEPRPGEGGTAAPGEPVP